MAAVELQCNRALDKNILTIFCLNLPGLVEMCFVDWSSADQANNLPVSATISGSLDRLKTKMEWMYEMLQALPVCMFIFGLHSMYSITGERP